MMKDERCGRGWLGIVRLAGIRVGAYFILLLSSFFRRSPVAALA